MGRARNCAVSVRFVPDGNPTAREWARILTDRFILWAFPIRDARSPRHF
ncbi:hypothetical protein QE418_003401 [Microbacterium testaceum]|nr:hypothetical protein [Microbacterium testaceum]MDR6098941.1 hypothetical protein [Microbacterium sp. SORGH_AS_0454]